jgi:hypothetical protein
MLHAGELEDMMKLTVTFCDFANTSKKTLRQGHIPGLWGTRRVKTWSLAQAYMRIFRLAAGLLSHVQ